MSIKNGVLTIEEDDATHHLNANWLVVVRLRKAAESGDKAAIKRLQEEFGITLKEDVESLKTDIKSMLSEAVNKNVR